jgi:phage terminase large subunit-like protein
VATDVISLDLQRTIRLLPGYDPFAQAGDCWFDEEAARHHIEFVEACCTHVKGELAGKPLLLEPWQKAIFANLYGWKRPDGTRRYRECLVFIPRGNGKTILAAALVCDGLYLEEEPGAELYSSAAESDQARLCFGVVTGMIRNEPEMERRAELFKYSIVVGDKSYKALTAQAGSKHGFNVQLLVNDELHAHKTPELTEVLMTGTGKRRQPLVVHLTTSDYEREGSICNEKHDYATKVRDGLIEDPAFLPVIYEATKEDDWTDPKVWCLAGDTKLYAKLPKGETVCTVRELVHSLDLKGVRLWDGERWVKVLGTSKAAATDAKVRLRLRSGQRISCTAHHQWPTQRGKMRADELAIGDALLYARLPESEQMEPQHIPSSLGWLIGLYLAEGSKTKEGWKVGVRRKLQFAGCASELDRWQVRMTTIVGAYHGTVHGHSYGNRCAVIVESPVVQAIVDQYVGGSNAHNKYLKPRTWRRSNAFLQEIVEGYLEGDAHYEQRTDRHRLGFCRNYRLADTLRTLAARLGAQCRIVTSFAETEDKRRPIYRGEWRWQRSSHANAKHDGEIVAIESSSARDFWHLGVENTSGLFALASGVLSYNSKANPNLGVSVPLEYLERECQRAKDDASYENTFKRLHLNIRTEQAFRLIQMDKWDANADAPEIPDNAPVYVALDLASVEDMASLVVVHDDGEQFSVQPHYWCPEVQVRNLEAKGEPTYATWVRQGLLTATPGNSIDVRAIRQRVLEIADRYDIRALAYDPWNATAFATSLAEEDGLPMVEHRQGTVSMNEPTKQLVSQMLERKLRHGGHPILRWNASNLAAKADPSGNLRPDKGASKGKIDGAVALIMALGRAVGNASPDADHYETHEVRSI